MTISTVWKEKMLFSSTTNGHEVLHDAKPPIGEGKAMTPKELVAVGLTGCTAMDVAALMKKHKQPVESFEVQTDVKMSSSGHPTVFEEVLLTFHLKGQLDAAIVLEAVKLSQTKYCGVSAMLSQVFPIRYLVLVNGETVGEGQASFSL